MTTSTPQKFGKLLSVWYARHWRDLPWRNTHDPYRIWVSEIMLQQTQVERVKDFYSRFLKRFPSVWDLAAASWEDVLECWRDPVPPGTPQVIAAQRRGLGYYRRARNMQTAAQVIMKDFGGKFPRRFEELKKLPGIGPYTAAAIASFAFGEKVPALDTNISRVFERVFGESFETLMPGERFEFARKYIGNLPARDFNYALMDLGSAVCHSRKPKCAECCFQKHCAYAQNGMNLQSQKEKVYRLPRGLRSLGFADASDDIPAGVIKVAAGVVIHKGKVLISKRLEHKPHGGLWEFPGGKLEFGEDARRCLKRELMEELGIEVSVRPAFHQTLTESEGSPVMLSFHRCSVLLGEARPLQVQEVRWVAPEELSDYEFPPANMELNRLLLSKKGMFRV